MLVFRHGERIERGFLLPWREKAKDEGAIQLAPSPLSSPVKGEEGI
jgi:hypothetical protein